MITPEEIIQIVATGGIDHIKHGQFGTSIMNEWYKYRSTQKNWLRYGENYEVFWMLGVVFFAGIVYGKRSLRYHKKQAEHHQ